MAVAAYAPSGPGTVAAGGPASANDYGQLAQLNSSLTPAQQAAGAALTGPGGVAAPPVNPYGAQAVAFYHALDTQRTAAANAAADQQYQDNLNKYIGSFQTSQAQAKQGLDRGLLQSLGALGQRRDAAAQVVAGIAPQIASQYGAVEKQDAASQAQLGKAIGGTQAAGIAAQIAPSNNALQQNKQTAMDTLPAYKLGTLAAFQSGEAALNQQHMVGEQQLNTDNAQFQTGLAHERMAHDQAIADRAAQYAHEDAAAGRQHGWDVEAEKAKEHFATEQNKTAADQAPTTEAALQGKGLTQGEVDRVRKSTLYSNYTNLINTNKMANPQNIEDNLRSLDPALLKVLQGEHADFFKSSGGKYVNVPHEPGPSLWNRLRSGGYNLDDWIGARIGANGSNQFTSSMGR